MGVPPPVYTQTRLTEFLPADSSDAADDVDSDDDDDDAPALVGRCRFVSMHSASWTRHVLPGAATRLDRSRVAAALHRTHLARMEVAPLEFKEVTARGGGGGGPSLFESAAAVVDAQFDAMGVLLLVCTRGDGVKLFDWDDVRNAQALCRNAAATNATVVLDGVPCVDPVRILMVACHSSLARPTY